MAISGEQIIQDILHPFVEALDHEGLTIKFLANRLKQELKASDTKPFLHQASGEIKEAKVPAWEIRQKARKDALAYRGVIAVEKRQTEIDFSKLTDNLTNEQLDLIIESLKCALAQEINDGKR